MLANINFFISEALQSIRRSALLLFISIGTITISLIVFGLFLLISANLNNLSKYFSSRIELRIYLTKRTTKHEIASFKKSLEEIEVVKEVTWVPKEKAWLYFQKNYKNIDFSSFIDKNPLPNSFVVTLTDNKEIKALSQHLKASYPSYIDDVRYLGEIAHKIESFASLAKVGGIVLVGFLTLATLLIIINTIRLTVIARQEEIGIMQLVGATNTFIRGPFIVEGIIIGGIGALISALFLFLAYQYLSSSIERHLPFFPLVTDPFQLYIIYLIVVFAGMILGILGAYISVTRTLHYKK
jgi:cell division transport system permease protein